MKYLKNTEETVMRQNKMNIIDHLQKEFMKDVNLKVFLSY